MKFKKYIILPQVNTREIHFTIPLFDELESHMVDVTRFELEDTTAERIRCFVLGSLVGERLQRFDTLGRGGGL